MALKKIAKQIKPAINKIMVSMMIGFISCPAKKMPFLEKGGGCLRKSFTSKYLDVKSFMKRRIFQIKKPSHNEKVYQNGVDGY